MHYTLTVALPGDIAPDKLRESLEDSMAPFDENREVELHRDTSVYAQHRDVQLADARACRFAEKYATMTDDEVLADWNGDTFDADGWPVTTRNPDGHWDWWVIGGRWGGAWTLRGENGPLATEESAFGFAEGVGSPQTDNARLSELEPESIRPTYSFIDLAGVWHTRWIGPTPEEANGTMPKNTDHWTVPDDEHAAKFLTFIANLPRDTWLVMIDYHC